MPVSPVVLLLSDQHQDVRDLLRSFPLAPWRVVAAPLKSTATAELTALHPDILLIDATLDPRAAEDATRSLALAWEIGLPPIIVVVDIDGISSFRFEVGADDFLLTDATSAEISARLTMIMRRAGHGEEEAVLKVGDLTVNQEIYKVNVRMVPLDQTYKEFELLKFLAQRPGRVCDRDLLLREVWGYDYYGGTRTVDVHIRRIRAKLGSPYEDMVETVRNVGYRFIEP